ncbi:MAG: integrase core domain-containing protein [Bacillus subtilis]|nr:integrase core domain-containing protein [Bacillus subtilis]
MIGWIKDELYKDFNLLAAEDPQQVIKDYIQYFNHQRRAYSLGYETPVQYRTERGMK